MAITSIDIDQNNLNQAKMLAGTKSDRETVELALRTLIAVLRQPTSGSGSSPVRAPISRS